MIKNTLLFVFLSVLCLSVAAQEEKIRVAEAYFTSGEYEKAADSYSELASSLDNTSKVYENYMALLLRLEREDEAKKYLKRLLKKYPEDTRFIIDMMIITEKTDGEKSGLKYLDDYTERISENRSALIAAGYRLLKRQRPELAERVYLRADNGSRKFTVELIKFYEITGNLRRLTEEILEEMKAGRMSRPSVENTLQNNLGTAASDFETVEKILYSRIQKEPSEIKYNELLIWLFLQQKEFEKAFIQGKAVERRKEADRAKNKFSVNRLVHIGQIAFNNEEFEIAQEIFEYTIDNYKESINYSEALSYLIMCKEERVKKKYPPDLPAIKAIIKDYDKLSEVVFYPEYVYLAKKNQAELYAFYLHDYDSAVVILNDLIESPRLSGESLSEALLVFGDVYLLKNEPWESTLLYSRVEKLEKESPLGHTAKLKNAKLSYYKGEFELAKSHLDILKLATSREIANDAMELSLLIGDNLAFDSVGTALKKFAAADLLILQNKYDEALHELSAVLNEFQGHSLSDDILYRQADIYRKKGDYEAAIDRLEKLLELYGNDILGDNALYMLANIYEENINDKEKAVETYLELMTKHPGSSFNVDARRKTRKLRGN